MKTIEPYTGYELGPIRPPSEAGSLLLRLTRNCPWNQCTFCNIYKGTKFSIRPVEHVLRDIDTVHSYVQKLAELSSEPPSKIQEFYRQPDTDSNALHAAHNFISNGMKSIFLQDGNSLILKPDDLITILEYLREAFPTIDRITSYARSQTIARISDDDLKRIADAGLNRIHIGMESAADNVLKFVKKGTTKEAQILAGQKVKKAGMELSEYWMPGLGGKPFSNENALETANALNQINPDYIRLRTLALPDGAPLTTQQQQGEFKKLGEVETAKELLLFLESLEGITSTVRSDHILNLFPEVDGKLPEEKEKIIAPVKTYLALPPEEQLLYSIGRRRNIMTRVADLDNPMKREQAERIKERLGATVENMDTIIDGIIKHFI